MRLLFVVFVIGWIILLVITARRFFLSVAQKKWWSMAVSGITLSAVVSLVSIVVLLYVAMQYPELF